jgi:Family of unknown function (DUF6627)
MRHFRTCNRILALPLIALFLITTVPLAPARAAFIGTEDVLRQGNPSTDREKVANFLQRQDVRQQLASLGVDAREANARVAALSDQEIAKIAGKIDQMPAGQGLELVLVVALIVLLVVLIARLAH